MSMRVLVDPRAGFCGGVRRVVKMAEKVMSDTGLPLVSLGDIIHNEVEIARLEKSGLSSIDHGGMAAEQRPQKVLIRAHGEPPETYAKAKELGVELIDGTCPVVTRSQNIARKHYEAGEQVVIIGKPYHPETIGIKGHCDNRAFVVYEREDCLQLDPNKKVFILAQTTVSKEWFEERIGWIRDYARDVEVQVENTLCRFVVGRDGDLEQFATQVDVIIMVGGTKSSNTKALYGVCKRMNNRAHLIVDENDLEYSWFRDGDTIGVTGSASTPHWLLEKVRDMIGERTGADVLRDTTDWESLQQQSELEKMTKDDCECN
ncbi:4-hydroxy-3-methylbut-2-enyl diphosphate reductase [bacterium]|nr:4-hydroxy-3-methylbut-2-enyl diphosphate reductase [bacterium]